MERLLQSFVHVVDDDASFRALVAPRLKDAGYKVAAYLSAQDFLDRLPSDDVPGCILLDLQLGLTGLKLQSRLRQCGSTLPLIFITASVDLPLTVKAIKAGAHNFLTKAASSDELLQAIAAAIAHHATMCGLKSRLDLVRGHAATLTPRQWQVFELVVRGLINRDISYALGCTIRTVKAHRHAVMEKMQVQTFAELVSVAERIGALPSGFEELQGFARVDLGDGGHAVPNCR